MKTLPNTRPAKKSQTTKSSPTSIRQPKLVPLPQNLDILPAHTIGIDLGDKSHHFSIVNAKGTIETRGTLPNQREVIAGFCAKWKGARTIIECGAQSPWISHFLSEQGMEVVVANPRRVKLISAGNTKSDRKDADLLARLGRADIQLLSPITHRSMNSQEDLCYVRVRDSLVQERVAMSNSIRGHLKALGYTPPSACTETIANHCRAQLKGTALRLVSPLCKVLDTLNAQIKVLDKKINAMLTQYPEAGRLAEVYGIGPITAVSFVLTIDDPHRFGRNRDLGPFLGMVPKKDQSGAVDKKLGITKAGDKLLRRLLVGSAQCILKEGAPESDLKDLGQRMIANGRESKKKQAVIAVARRLGILLLSLWKSGQPYDPTRNLAIIRSQQGTMPTASADQSTTQAA
jgi:transposase